MIKFGPFEVDSRTWTLSRNGESIDLSPRLVEILAFVVVKNGEIVTKAELLERFWPDVNVSDNTLTRAIADIRKALGDTATRPAYVQTAARRGYRFVGALGASGASSASGVGDPFQDWVDGRLALDSLDADRLKGAVQAFERAVLELPSYAPAHAGLANAYLLQYESTRSGVAPNRDLLLKAIDEAQKATSLDPAMGEGWAVLAHLLTAAGQLDKAQAAARHATAIEPGNWRHHYRLAQATWGEERLRSVDRALALMPNFGPARMLAAMVFVARGAIDRAEREATLGAEAQSQQRNTAVPLRAVGLHWLRGLILAARGEFDAALESLNKEIAAGSSGHIYGREFLVNAQVAAGFILAATGDTAKAAEAFERALAEVPGHAKATAGLFAISNAERSLVERAIDQLSANARHSETALVKAALHLKEGNPGAALEVLDQLISTAPTGPAGWIIPVDPMLAALRSADGWPDLQAKLAVRAA